MADGKPDNKKVDTDQQPKKSAFNRASQILRSLSVVSPVSAAPHHPVKNNPSGKDEEIKKEKAEALEGAARRPEEKPKPKRCGNCCRNLKDIIVEYTIFSGLHGLHYLSSPLSILEKVFWVFVLTTTYVLCTYLVVALYIKYNERPVIVGFASTDSSLHTIPFPAITVCPDGKASRYKYDRSEIAEKLRNKVPLTEMEAKAHDFFDILCEQSHPSHVDAGNLTTVNAKEFFNIINDVKPRFEDMFFKCKYLGRNMDCFDLFTPTLTAEGICYTFNFVNRSEIFEDNLHFHSPHWYRHDQKSYWNTQSGYDGDAGVDTYPNRALYTGEDRGLRIYFSHVWNMFDFSCKSYIQGFKILLHLTNSVPLMDKFYFYISMNENILNSITPSVITTDKNVKQIAKSKRRCALDGDKKLEFFKIYTHDNCQLECLTKYTFRECKCVHFYMPSMYT